MKFGKLVGAVLIALVRRRWSRVLAILAAMAMFQLLPASGADKLDWKAAENRVSADIDSLELETLLRRVSAAAGWEVYVEPGIQHTVSTKFSDLKAEEALRRLLGKLNYALVPQTNGPPRFLVFNTAPGDATRLVSRPEGAAEAATEAALIPNELIVTLKPDCGVSIDELARRAGAKVVGRSDRLLAYRLQFPDEAATKTGKEILGAERCAEGVHPNFAFKRPPTPEAVSLSSLAPLQLKVPANDSGQVVVGLIDTGVQSLGPDMDAYLLPGINIAGDSPGDERISHGTAMAQSILQAAGCTSPRILPVNIYGGQQTTTTYEVARGIYEAVQGGARIVNLSLGSPGDSPFLRSIIQQAHSQGVLFFAAAGNEPTTAPTYPAAYPEVNAVTSIDRSGRVASFANRGSFVNLGAPAANIVTFNQNSYYVTGTSVSTALAAGLAAGLSGCGGTPLNQVEQTLQQRIGFTPSVR